MKERLSEDFIIELIKLCITEKRVFERVRGVLKYTYFNEEALKEIWKEVNTYFDLHGKLPTIGILSESFKDKREVRQFLAEIKKTVKPDTSAIIEEFDGFIKRMKFIELNNKIVENYNNGESIDKSLKALEEMNDEIKRISIGKNVIREKLYDGFEQRHKERQERSLERESGGNTDLYIPTFGIDALDYYDKGRLSKGDLVGVQAQSGVGKSTILRWFGICNSQAGGIGVHFQGEDTKVLCSSLYDSAWTGREFDLVANAKLSPKDIDNIIKASKNTKANGGELFIEAFEKFGTASLRDCYNILLDIEKEAGRIDFIIWDYLEKFDPGDGKRYKTDTEGEKARRTAVGDKMKNILLEFNAVGFTGTQASNVPPEKLNDHNFVMTRHHISANKAMLDPFSYWFTLNQTEDEDEDEQMRIYIDKLRKSKKGGDRIINIVQQREVGRFYDRKKTLEFFWDAENNKPMNN